MRLADWIDRLSPDLMAAFRRFPLATLLIVAATVAFLALINNWVDSTDETWSRLAIGLATGAVVAAAGSLFGEGRPGAPPVVRFLFGWLLPVGIAASFEIRSTAWFVPYGLPIAAILWLSVSGFTHAGRGAARQDQQNRYWWFNEVAATTAAVALVALLIIGAGLVAIERSVLTLFGVQSDWLLYNWLLPIAGFLLTPIYWLSTLPRLTEYREQLVTDPDTVGRAAGFLGQFVVTPLVLAYALILVSYGVQIVAAQTLPQGVIGWMVLAFLVGGAANWLLLHPPFMRDRLLVRVFRASWFWLTLAPLALYAVAVWVRLDAYGFTPERLVLVWAGLWAVSVTVVFLIGLGDIRIIPTLAGIVILVATIGPWNIENLARVEQSLRLEALLTGRNADPSTSLPAMPVWTNEERQRATGAIAYLALSGDESRAQLHRVLQLWGHDLPADAGIDTMLASLGQGSATPPPVERSVYLERARGPLDLRETPILLGSVSLATGSGSVVGPLLVEVSGLSVTLSTGDGSARVLANGVLDPSGSEGVLASPLVDFELEGVSYRLVVSTVALFTDAAGAQTIQTLDGLLFADRRP